MRKFISFLTVSFALNSHAAILNGPLVRAGKLPQLLKVKFNSETLDLKTRSGLSSLRKMTELKIRKTNPNDRKDLMVLEELIGVIDVALDENRPKEERQEALLMVAEIADTQKNEERLPLPRQVDIPFTIAFVAIDYLNNPFGKGENGQANNLVQNDEKDKSKVDPMESTFWKNPGNIASKEVYYGFGRSALRDFSKPCDYKGPKDSLGAHAGFVVDCNKDEVKVKFGEESSEPFGSRIFDLLGFNVEPTDFADDIQVNYNRSYFQEFNLRKAPVMTVSFAAIPVYNFDLFKTFNPMIYIKRLKLKDGTSIEAENIPTFLLKKYDPKTLDFANSNFNLENEAKVAQFIFRPANIQTKNKKLKSIGAWDFNRLEKNKRRELRGMGILGAWLNWYDARWDNTRLKIRETETGRELVHFINDTGSVLGEAGTLLNSESGEVNRFPWTFTEIYQTWERVRPDRELPKKLVTNLRFVDFKMAYDDTDPFRDMTIEDARWMARRIAQITEKQLIDALVASGFSSAETKLFLEKLINRRDKMIRDLGLKREFSYLRTKAVRQNFNYDPGKDGVMSGGPNNQFSAPIRDQKIEKGICTGCKTNYPIVVTKRS